MLETNPLHFLQAFPPSSGAKLLPLVAPEFTTTHWRAMHAAGQTLSDLPALGVWKVEDIVVAGMASHLFMDDEFLCHPSIVPRYVVAQLSKPKLSPDGWLALDERVIDEPVVVFTGWGLEVYGHGLVETLPKILIAAKALECAPEDLTYLLPSRAPEWFRELISLTGASKFIEFDPLQEKVLLRQAWVVTTPHDVALHPACGRLFDDLLDEPVVRNGEKIFISRRRASVTRAVHMQNIEEIEQIAIEKGFAIVSPEQLPFEDQFRLYAGAGLVVGEYGSALMNTVMCGANTVVGAIGSRSNLLSAISAVKGFQVSYFDPLSSPESLDGYSVDEAQFADWLDALLAASN